ncbi:hypothetical protein RUM43_000930 [Polyplax serrata]|uniref:Uncharacterized protein n=1 Tax=Polyplax serrata TaxID=468196 RepID=A0AAN8SGV5_POLSC
MAEKESRRTLNGRKTALNASERLHVHVQVHVCVHVCVCVKIFGWFAPGKSSDIAFILEGLPFYGAEARADLARVRRRRRWRWRWREKGEGGEAEKRCWEQGSRAGRGTRDAGERGAGKLAGEGKEQLVPGGRGDTERGGRRPPHLDMPGVSAQAEPQKPPRWRLP